MIHPVNRSDLPSCLAVFHRGYETVAEEFGLTEGNCPDRGRASLPYETLLDEYERGTRMYAYHAEGQIVGFMGMRELEPTLWKLEDIVILPEHRQRGYGKALLDFCKEKARERGGTRLQLGMIDDNARLRRWYEENGFVNIGYKRYEGAPFTVGRMECELN